MASNAQDPQFLYPATPDATPMAFSDFERGLNFRSVLAPTGGMSVADYNAKNFARVPEYPEAGVSSGEVQCAAWGSALQSSTSPVHAQGGSVPGLVVKNTFIDGFDSDEEDVAIMSHKLGVHSLPIHLLRNANYGTSRSSAQAATAAVLNQPFVQPSPPMYMAQAPTMTTQYNQMAYAGQPMQAVMMAPVTTVMMPQQMAPMQMNTTMQMAKPSSPVSTSSGVVVPYKQRQPEHSAGSSLHGTGQCRPCAWFWKPQGCANCADCRHCHLCPEGELKNRKKDKVSTMKDHTGHQ